MRKLLFIAIPILFFSCSKDEQVNLVVSMDAFHSIEINSTFEVQLQEDNSYYIEIIGAQDFAESVIYEVSDSTLKLNDDSGNKWTHPKDKQIVIVVHAPPLKLVTANETSLLTTLTPITSHEFGLIMKGKSNTAELDLQGDIFYYWNNFPTGGILTLHGNVHELKVWNTGIMTVDGRDLIAAYAQVENDAESDCIVTVAQQIKWSITDEGNIHLYGSPPYIEQMEHSGSGGFIEH